MTCRANGAADVILYVGHGNACPRLGKTQPQFWT